MVVSCVSKEWFLMFISKLALGHEYHSFSPFIDFASPGRSPFAPLPGLA
jgi:hypothetical protein